MSPLEIRPFGSWPSPITPASLVDGVARVTELATDADDVWYAESRPSERGRTVVVHWHAGRSVDAVGPDANVRTLVHEYGGGAWWVHEGTLFHVDFDDQRLRRRDPGADAPVVLTPEPEIDRGDRFADGAVTPDGRWTVCVRERHAPHGREPANELVAVATDGSLTVHTLVSGPDFVAAPRLSPDGTRLAWIQWMHPDMPWDATELWLGEFADGVLTDARRLAGGGSDESLVQPGWSPDGRLLVVSDRSDWWGLYEVDLVAGAAEPLRPVHVEDGVELAEPDWVFGQRRWTILADGTLVRGVVAHPRDRLLVGDPPTAVLPGASFVPEVRACGNRIAAVVASQRHEAAVTLVDPRTGAWEAVRPPDEHGLDDAFLPDPEPITFPTTGGAVAHALFYRPAHPDVAGPDGEAPPLVVLAHGGPTDAAINGYDPRKRFWTSRGMAVVDVDYRGSTGYGRRYRKALDGQWGVVDVEDCIAVVHHLVAAGEVDPARVVVRGGSAGGYVVLRALSEFDVFTAGICYFGVADLEALATETHKFESRYLDRLVAPYPEGRDVYVARSPVHHVDRLSVPMLVLQGLDDPVVPPGQSEMIVEALERKGVPVAYLAFEGESHGFRKAETIVAAAEAELAFLGSVFGFAPADPVGPLAWRG